VPAFPADWRDRAFLALDFETTGLDPRVERVVEIGAVLSRGERQVGAFASLVKPGIHIPRVVVDIHGIRDEDVETSPIFADLAPLLEALARGATIVAHNAPFDLAFLRMELARAGLPAPANEVLDTRNLARAAFPGLPSYKLGSLAAHFGIPPGRSHRALDDAHSCLALLLLCAEKLAPLGR
jgi:DNA polymerase-3 subunit epsilon